MLDNLDEPIVKDKICFADDLTQATKAMRNGYKDSIEGFTDTDKLMFFGVENWKQKAQLDALTDSFEESTFQKVEFFGCELGAEGTKSIADGFAKQGGKAIRTLDLDHSPIDGAHAKYFFEKLNTASVADLNLQGSVREEASFKSMMHEMGSNKSITSLNLRINAIKGAWCDKLEDFLTTNDSVESIDLFYNELDIQGAVHIAHGLKKDQNVLRVLNLSCNNIQSAGCAAIASSLLANTHLVELDLSLNSIGDHGATILFMVLAGIDILEPEGGKFGREYMEAEKAMKDNYVLNEHHDVDAPNSLKKLDISANNIEDGALAMLGTLATNNRSLELVDFTGCEGTAEGWKNLLAGFGQNIATQRTQEFHFSVVDIPSEVLPQFDELLEKHERFFYKRRAVKPKE